MRPSHTLAGVMLASAFTITDAAAQQQQLAGPWAHDANAPVTLYVSPAGHDGNGGLSDSDPLLTIGAAVAKVDELVPEVISAAQDPSVYGNGGVTINLAPGEYTCSSAIEIPAFGLCIEAGRGVQAGAGVTVCGQPGGDVFRITDSYGAFGGLDASQRAMLPPSELRDLRIDCPANSVGLRIDMSSVSQSPAADIAVGVHGCTFRRDGAVNAPPTGIVIRSGALGRPMRNEIVDNDFDGLLYALRIHGGGVPHSDLVRSNRIQRCLNGIEARSEAGAAASIRPRILSNAIAGCGTQSNWATYAQLSLCFGVRLDGGSGQVIGNTIAFTRNQTVGQRAAGVVVHGPSSGLATAVIANNLLYNPGYLQGGAPAAVSEIWVSDSANVSFVIESNDHGSSLVATNLNAGEVEVGAGNMPIANPFFASTTVGAFDLHLTAASTAVVHQGDLGFVRPGAGSAITAGGRPFDASCALDVDLDSRTAREAGAAAAAVRRGADQPSDVALRAPASADVDALGTVTPEAGSVTLELDAPAGSTAFVFLSLSMPDGAAMQHHFLPGLGSLAMGTDPAGFLMVGQVVVAETGATTPFDVELPLNNLDLAQPFYDEADSYLQAWIFRPDGTQTLTNRLRLEQESM